MPKLLPVVFVRVANLSIRSFTYLLKVCRNVLVRSLRLSRKHSFNSVCESCDALEIPFLNSISLRINSCFRTIMPLAQQSSRAFLPTFYKNAKEISSVTRASATFFLRRTRSIARCESFNARHTSSARAHEEQDFSHTIIARDCIVDRVSSKKASRVRRDRMVLVTRRRRKCASVKVAERAAAQPQ